MVNLGERSYPICIGTDMLDRLGPRLQELALGRRVAVVTNPVVARFYREPVEQSLKAAGFEPTVVQVPDGEEHKNLAWLAFLYDRLVDARLDRTSAIVALGGGVIGDLTGFTAATFQRGRALRAGADHAARAGRLQRRRQDGSQSSRRQEPHRRVLPAAAGVDRRRDAEDAAAPRGAGGHGRGDQARRHPRPARCSTCSRRSSRPSWRSTRRC